MNENLLNLEPAQVWKHFRSLTLIPRPSKKEEGVIAFMKQFGESLGLTTLVDEVGNVIIKKPATPNMENRKGVILQAHLDMVPQKNSDKQHDFEKDPIQTRVEEGWVKATGTTLGADNGIGVAAAMAVLESKTLVHGPVEALLTIDEETGMTGAFGLKPGLLDGEILLNLDSEDEGELYIGCAGGINAMAQFNYQLESCPKSVKAYKISITGLKGGHSGLDINLGRGNSNKILFRILHHASKQYGLRIASIDGGSLRNAIPREAFAEVVIPIGHVVDFEKFIVDFTSIVKKELSTTEPELKIEWNEISAPVFVMDESTQQKLILSVYACPNGVIRMSADMENLVETSTNLAIVKAANGLAQVICLLRSSVDSAKDDLANMVASVFELAGAKVTLDGAYPGWKPNPVSPILTTMKQLYQQLYGKTPEVKAIHAGLECGLLGAVYPKWDMISFGPTIRFPHSPDEKVNIESVGKFWNYLVHTLENIPVK